MKVVHLRGRAFKVVCELEERPSKYKKGVVASCLVSPLDGSLVHVYNEYRYDDGRCGWSLFSSYGTLMEESSSGFDQVWWEANK